jgi:chromosome segregation ATPase
MKATRQQTTFILALATLFFAGTTLLFWSERNAADTRVRQINEASSLRLATLVAEKEAATQTATQTKGHLDTREKQLASLQAQHTRIQADATKAQTSVTELDKKLTNARHELETHRADAERARADAAELDKKLTDTRAQVDALNAELAKHRDDTTVQSLQAENERLWAFVEDHQGPAKVISQLRIQVLERAATIDNLNGKLTSLSEKVTELEAENKRLKAPPRRIGSGMGTPDYRGL